MDVQGQFPDREIEDFAPQAAPLGEPVDWFSSGNFCGAASSPAAESWQTAAALGLIGNTAPAIAGLEKTDSAKARFYLGAALWIEGNEIDAADVEKI